MNTEFLKKHWHLIAAGLAGVLVLYYLLKTLGGSSAGSTGSKTSSSDQVQALNAAADLQNNQSNAQVAIAAYQAGVVNNQTIASLQAAQTHTAAELAATLHGQDTALAATENTNASVVELQHITSSAAVAQTVIEGETIAHISDSQIAAAEAVKTTQLKTVANQIGVLMAHSKHFGTDIVKITPLLTSELGDTTASVAASRTSSTDLNASAAKTGAIVGGVTSIASSLFGGLFA